MRLKSNIIIQKSSDCDFLFNEATGQSFQLNSVAALICRSLSSGSNYGLLVSQVSQSFNVEPDTASIDVLDFLSQLSAYEFIADEE